MLINWELVKREFLWNKLEFKYNYKAHEREPVVVAKLSFSFATFQYKVLIDIIYTDQTSYHLKLKAKVFTDPHFLRYTPYRLDFFDTS